MNKIIHFIKYHNAFAIGISLVLVLTFSAMASEDVRDALIGEKIETWQGMDNSQLLAADLDNFDLQMQIINVAEDENKYYVTYQYRTLAVKDNVWQPVVEQPTLTVYKDALGESDLGLYVAEKLSEVADYVLNFLKEVQTAEKEKGLTKLATSVEYTGLIGLVLDIKEKVLPGYQPVVQAPESEPQITGESKPPLSSEPAQPLTLQVITEEQLAQMLNQQQNQPGEQPPTETPPAENACDAAHLNLCMTQAECETAAGFWYNEGCNAEPREETEEAVCDKEHLDLCTTQELCEGAGLYWHDDTCNSEPQSEEPACIPEWQCSDWQPTPETVACGETFTQNRTSTDLNSCDIEEGKPIEEQQAIGTDASTCSAINATGVCQDGTCSFTCNEGYQKDDSGACQPIESPTGE